MDNRRTSYNGTLTKQRDPLELRAAKPEQGLLDGYASKWWTVDSYAEATAPGAFATTIQQRGPSGADRILLRYEHQVTIGKHTAMAEDATGLLIEALVSNDGMDGTRVRTHLADGVRYGLSIGFRRISDRTAEDDDPLDLSSAPDWVKTLPRNEIRILTGVQLYENSVVSFPAVEPALVNGYRADPDFETLLARLTPEQRAALTRLLNETPGEIPGPADGETLSVSPVVRAALRNRHAEFELIRADLARLGVTA